MGHNLGTSSDLGTLAAKTAPNSAFGLYEQQTIVTDSKKQEVINGPAEKASLYL
jgi:hypothetical protein